METIVIDIQARYEDKTSEGYRKTQQQADRLGDSIKKTQQQAEKFAGGKYEAALQLKDRALAGIQKTASALSSMTRKAWNVTVGFVDKITRPLRNLVGGIINPILQGIGISAGMGIGNTISELISESSRNQELEIVMKQMAKSNNVDYNVVKKARNEIREKGITKGEATSVTNQFLQTGLDLNQAAPLARAAQNFGVNAQMNSSEALSRMVTAISRLEPVLLEPFGLKKSMNDVYDDYIKTKKLSTKAKELTTDQKRDAMLQYIFEENEKVNGVYEEAMGAAGKKSRSLTRLKEDLSDMLGSNLFLPVYGKSVDLITKLLKNATTWAEANQDTLARWGENLANGAEALFNKAEAFFGKVKGIMDTPEFKDADLFGKVKILWNEIIYNPFKNWWDGEGKEKVGQTMKSVGAFIAEGIIEGLKIGAEVAFSNPVTGAIASGFIATKVIGAIGPISSAIKGISTFVKGTGAFINGTSAMAAASGGSAAAQSATAFMGAQGGAGAVGATVGVPLVTAAGAIAGAAGLISSAVDFAKANDTLNTTKKNANIASGATKAGMVAIGAAIGTAIAPGIGTAIGAGIGGIVAIFGGSRIGEAVAGWIDGTGKIEKSAEALKKVTAEYNEAKTKADAAKKANDAFADSAKKLAEAEANLKKNGGVDVDAQKQKEQALDTQKQILQDMIGKYPDLFTQYDIENGYLQKNLDLVLKREEAEKRMKLSAAKDALRELEGNFDNVEKKVKELDAQKASWENKKNVLNEQMANIYDLKTLSNQLSYELAPFEKERDDIIAQANKLPTRQAKPMIDAANADYESKTQYLNEYYIPKIFSLIDDLKKTTGIDFNKSNNLNDVQATIDKEMAKLNKGIEDNIKQGEKIRGEYQQLYNAKVAVATGEYEVDNNRSFTDDKKRLEQLNEQVKNFKDGKMTDEQQVIKKEFEELSSKLDPVISKIQDINKEMSLIPKELKINVDFAVKSTGSMSYADILSLGKGPLDPTKMNPFSNNPLGPPSLYPPLIPKHATGGMFSVPHLGLVAEAGPEAIIPLSSNRRNRGLELWQQAGQALGVRAYADGGIPSVGSSSSGSSGITITLGGINITIGGGGDTQSIIAAIREQMPDIANELCEYLAKELGKIYSNMPILAR